MKHDNVTGKTVLVTGAGSGLGRAMALDLAAEGMNIILHYHSSQETALSALAEVKSRGVKGWILKQDLTRTETIQELFPRALELSKHVDFLINSASVYTESTLDSLQPEDVIAAVNMNAVTPFLLARSFRNTCGKGAVINILDARMVDYDRKHVAYSLSKQMLFSLTRMMSVEFAPRIRVNAVAPGIITPPAGTGKKVLDRMKEATLLKRTGTPGEISAAVLSLMSNSFITGETIFVDGGRNIKGKMFGL